MRKRQSSQALGCRLGVEALEAGVAEEVAVGGAAEQRHAQRLASSWPICVTPLRETTIGTPIWAAFITISLVSRPVV
jgi:hypothetical protein